MERTSTTHSRNPTETTGDFPEGKPTRKRKLHLRGPYSTEEGFEALTRFKRASTGIRVYLSDLAFCTSQQDLMGLFSRFESVEDCNLYYDCFGRPLGAGEVVFTNFSAAKAAMKQFDALSIYLNDKELNLEIGMKFSDLPENLTNSGNPPPPPPQTGAGATHDPLQTAAQFLHVYHSSRGPTDSGNPPQAAQAAVPPVEPSRKPRIYLDGPYSKTEGFEASTRSRIRTGTRLYLSNLAFCTSQQDVMGLFSRIKSIENCSLYYDCYRRPLGAGEVVFSNRSDALAAMKEFASVDLYLYEQELKMEIGMKYCDLPEGGDSTNASGLVNVTKLQIFG